MKEILNKRLFQFCFLFVLIAGILFSFIFFQKNVNTILAETSQNFLLKTSRIYAEIIKEKISVGSFIPENQVFSILDDADIHGCFYIISQDGSVILCNHDEEDSCSIEKLFPLLSDRIAEEESGAFNYKDGKEKRICSYTPVGVNGWGIICSVPADFIGKQNSKVQEMTVLLVCVITLVFVFFVVMLTNLVHKTDEVRKDNERFSLATEQNQSLIFEMDLGGKTVSFSGDTKFILGKEIKTFSIKDFKFFYDRVHEDDYPSMMKLRDSVLGEQKSFSSEVRLKCSDGNYYWFRFSGTPILSNDGKSKKLFASLTNVNQQRLHENELRHIAETDALSGLLNKSFFQQKIEAYIKEHQENARCLFFIVDLDNFKKVNDLLGHSVGDLAIKDAGGKLTRLFSVQDYISRFGGDEFCIFTCLKEAFDHDSAISFAHEKATLLCNIMAENYFNEKTYVEVTASVGISLYPDDGKDFAELFVKADTALYNTKRNGKNGYSLYSPDMKDGSESVYDV